LYGAGVAGALYCANAVSPPYIETQSDIALAPVRSDMSIPPLTYLRLASPPAAFPLQTLWFRLFGMQFDKSRTKPRLIAALLIE
jgi:hypothetical protein